MNCFHIPRGFSVASTIAPRWSPLPTSTILTLRLPVDPLPLQPFSSDINLDMSPLHATRLWSLVCRLSSYAFPITRYSIYLLCTDQLRHILTNPTTCAGVPPTLLHLPDSHLNRSPRLPLVRLWILVNRKSYLSHRTASTSAAGHPMTRKRRKSGNETMIQMMT
jgi:hypothetical protein